MIGGDLTPSASELKASTAAIQKLSDPRQHVTRIDQLFDEHDLQLGSVLFRIGTGASMLTSANSGWEVWKNWPEPSQRAKRSQNLPDRKENDGDAASSLGILLAGEFRADGRQNWTLKLRLAGPGQLLVCAFTSKPAQVQL
jgi:hypothetical protein